MKLVFWTDFDFNPEVFNHPASIVLSKTLLMTARDCNLVTEYQAFNVYKGDKEFLPKTIDFKPDLIIYSPRHDIIKLDQGDIKAIHSQEIPILTIVWDSYPSPWVNHVEEYWLSCATYLAIVDSITSFYRYKALSLCYQNLKGVVFLGGNHVFTDIFKHKSLKKEHDVFFIGTKMDIREYLVKYLEEHFVDSDVSLLFGGGFSAQQALSYEKYVELVNSSKICLSSDTQSNQKIKGRVFEYLACGAFCLSDYSQEIARFFPSDCLATYTDFDDCIDKIIYYLNNPAEREAIAQRGHQWFHETFNYQKFWISLLVAIANKDHHQVNLIGESMLPAKYQIGC